MPTQSAVAPAGQKVTIQHVDWWAPNQAPTLAAYFDGIKKDFEAKHPDLAIDYIFVPNGTGGVREKWITLTAGGVPFESSQVSVAFIRDLMVAHLMEPLDPYIGQTKDMDLSLFVDSGLFYNTFEGKHFGIPYDGPTTNLIAYNTDHFKEASLDPSRDFTWKWTDVQFLDAAKRLTKTQGSQVTRGGLQPPGLSIDNFLPWLYANGGAFYDKTDQHVVANDQHDQGALQFMLDLRTKYGLAATAKDAALENEGYSTVISGSYNRRLHPGQESPPALRLCALSTGTAGPTPVEPALDEPVEHQRGEQAQGRGLAMGELRHRAQARRRP